MANVSTIGAPDTVSAPAFEPPARRGLGSMRSMVISMVVIMAAVLAWVAMVPRVNEISQPAVDVTAVTQYVRQETGWTISQPQLPPGWKATNVRFDSTAGTVRAWHAGYLSPEGQYLSIDQAQRATATSTWISARTSNGVAEGTLFAAGRTWRKLNSRGVLQRSLVSTVPGTRGLTTVLSGTAPYPQLAQFAETLKPVPAS
jgi:hypothetical protein